MAKKKKAQAPAAKALPQKLVEWQKKFGTAESAYSGDLGQMDEREEIYKGRDELTPLTAEDTAEDGSARKATHVWNITAESIEGQISAAIPQPKVTALRKEDEDLASLIEDMIRNELNRLPFDQINDLQERTVKIQGGSHYHVEFDNSKRTHKTVGEIVVSPRHPKQVIPQDGVYVIEEMDYIFLKVPQTKEFIKRRYNKNVDSEGESAPEVKGAGDATNADDMVTQIIALYRNEDGGIGLYSWVNDIELEDLDDCQVRRLKRCERCGAVEPIPDMEYPVTRRPAVPVEAPPEAGMGVKPIGDPVQLGDPNMDPDALPENLLMLPAETEFVKARKGVCPFCGGTKWKDSAEEYEEVYSKIENSRGLVIPGATPGVDDNGLPTWTPTRIPFYKPNCYPLVLQKNVSVYGQYLGDSDVDKVKYQQNTLNRMETKIIDRLIDAGTRITLPDRADLKLNPHDTKPWLVTPQEKACIGVYDFSGDLTHEMGYLAQVYEEARKIVGLTDSFQGREDSTAQSGVAKRYSAAQAAGRLESKRVMKDAAYADLFKLIFQFKLAYTDEPRPVVSIDEKGNVKYQTFDRYDFLMQDEAGAYYWNDQFLFATDTTAPLANNREQMWQITTEQFQAGAFGDPTRTETLLLLWTKLELLHFPGAGDTKTYLEKRLQEEKDAQLKQLQMQLDAQEKQAVAERQLQEKQNRTDIDNQARQDAKETVNAQRAEAQRRAGAQPVQPVQPVQPAQQPKPR